MLMAPGCNGKKELEKANGQMQNLVNWRRQENDVLGMGLNPNYVVPKQIR
jgi:hypothetical protein